MSLLFGIFAATVILATLFIALFISDKNKLFISLAYTGIGCFSLLLLFSDFYAMPYVLGIPIMIAILAVMVLCEKKIVPWICWALTVLLFMLLATVGISAILGYGRGDYTFFASNMPIYVILIGVLAPYLLFLGLMIATSVLRKKRRKKGVFGKVKAAETFGTGGYYASRIRRGGCVVVGNIFSAISYLFTLIGIRLALEAAATRNDSYHPIGFVGENAIVLMIYMFVAALVCGGIAWLLFRYSISYGYEAGAVEFALYIWSWIPTVIIIALIVITVVVICACGSGEFSSVANKRVYKVIDENGEERTLDYDGQGVYAKCMDDKGEWWETTDGGNTFRKCDLYKIEDENGSSKYIRDVSGGGKRIFSDGQGGTYESDDGGKTVIRQ